MANDKSVFSLVERRYGDMLFPRDPNDNYMEPGFGGVWPMTGAVRAVFPSCPQ